MSTALATETRPMSHAEKAKARLDQFMASLEQRNDQIATLLTDSGVDPAVFLAVSRRALTKTPELLECTPASLMQAFINAATDGLPPDGRKGAITYFKMKDGTKTAQWNPMVQGLLEIAYRSRQFLSIEAQVVYKGEPFEYQLGDDPFIRHRRTADAVAGREIVNAYAIARTTNGGVFREVMEKPDLDKIRNVSRAQNGPNKDWPEEMARKAPLRRLWKYLPKTPAMDRITDHDDQTYDLDAVRVERPAPRLATGFAPRALTQDATPTVEPIRTAEAAYAEIDDDEHETPSPRTGEQPGGEASSEAGPQAEASLSRDRPETPADREGITAEGTGAEQSGSAPPAAEGAPSLRERVDAFKKRVTEAGTTIKLKSIHAAAGSLRKEVDIADPDLLTEMDDHFNARFTAVEDEEKARRAEGQR